MPRRVKKFQSNFSAGALAPDLEMRTDTQQYQNGARTLRNTQVLIGGGGRRRPGLERMRSLAGRGRVVEWNVDSSTRYLVVFTDGLFSAFTTDNTAAGTITDCPWGVNEAMEFDYVQFGNSMIVTHPTFLNLIKRTGATTWTKQGFPFRENSDGRKKQPHIKLADQDVTLTPSARNGSVTLTTGADHWQDYHFGDRVRYFDKELQITQVISPRVAQATVKELLPASFKLTFSSSSGFSVGDVVRGDTSGTRAEVRAIISSTEIGVVILGDYNSFEAGVGFEELIGPSVVRTITAVDSRDPLPVTDWSEMLYSDEKGWPNSVELHRGRILFGGSASLPNGVAGSSTSDVFDFDVGDASDADGFLETVGDSAAVEIRQLHSAESLLLLTDRGPYYVPESSANPFRPTSLAFNHFGGTWPTNPYVRAVDFDDGMVFTSGNIVIKAEATGDLTKSWSAREVSFIGAHLIDGPTNVCAVDNFNGGSERYVHLINTDGTMCVMSLVDIEKVRNFVPWDTEGDFISTASIGGTVYVVVERNVGGQTEWWLEKFNPDLTLDGALRRVNETALTTIYSSIYHSAEGLKVVSDSNPPVALGTFPFAGDPIVVGPYWMGWDYVREMEILPPVIEDARGNHTGDLMRIVSAQIRVLSSARFSVNGNALTAYEAHEDVTEPAPLRTRHERFTFLGGWKRDPTLTITQTDPLPLTILSVQTEVAY